VPIYLAAYDVCKLELSFSNGIKACKNAMIFEKVTVLSTQTGSTTKSHLPATKKVIILSKTSSIVNLGSSAVNVFIKNCC